MEYKQQFTGSEWLEELGYKPQGNAMDGEIEEWWNLYSLVDGYYKPEVVVVNQDNGQHMRHEVNRRSMNPWKMVCRDMAALLWNDDTRIHADDAATDGILQSWLDRTRFMHSNIPVERMCATGTEAIVARFSQRIEADGEAGAIDVRPTYLDARDIIPLVYDEEGCRDIAVRSVAVANGRKLTQLQVHRANADTGTREICTAFFDDDGNRIIVDDVPDVFDCKTHLPTFALLRLSIDNTYDTYSPLGVALFDAAIDAGKTADVYFDNFNKDGYLGAKRVFMAKSLLDADEDGNVVIPYGPDQQLFVATESNGVFDENHQGIVEYNPQLRTEENRSGINTGLQLLGKMCGFGFDFYRIQKDGGISHETARAVVSSNAELVRNVKNHEETIGPAVERFCEMVLDVMRLSGVAGIRENCLVSVVYGDTVVDSTDADRENDRADVAAGLMLPEEYRAKWYGDGEKAAAEEVSAQAPDDGIGV